MANNPYINKVVYGNQTLLDLTSDTVNANSLQSGKVAHDASGASITGTASLKQNSEVIGGKLYLYDSDLYSVSNSKLIIGNKVSNDKLVIDY